jgi:hypothetical protein
MAAAFETPVFPIALRGLAILNATSAVLGLSTSFVPPDEDGETLVAWQLEDLTVVVHLTPNEETVTMVTEMQSHPKFIELSDALDQWKVDVALHTAGLDLKIPPSRGSSK